MATKRKTDDEATDAPELRPAQEVVARFQVETDARLAAFEAECMRRMGAAEHRAALLQDQVAALTDRVAALHKRFEGTEHELRQATQECNTALRRAVEYAEAAQESAAVYERLRDAQPDYRGEVEQLRRDLGSALDRVVHLEEQHDRLRSETDRANSRLADVAIQSQTTARALDGGSYVTAVTIDAESI